MLPSWSVVTGYVTLLCLLLDQLSLGTSSCCASVLDQLSLGTSPCCAPFLDQLSLGTSPCCASVLDQLSLGTSPSCAPLLDKFFLLVTLPHSAPFLISFHWALYPIRPPPPSSSVVTRYFTSFCPLLDQWSLGTSPHCACFYPLPQCRSQVRILFSTDPGINNFSHYLAHLHCSDPCPNPWTSNSSLLAYDR